MNRREVKLREFLDAYPQMSQLTDEEGRTNEDIFRRTLDVLSVADINKLRITKDLKGDEIGAAVVKQKLATARVALRNDFSVDFDIQLTDAGTRAMEKKN